MNSVNLSSGNQRLCPECKGLKFLAPTEYNPDGKCWRCGGAGKTEPLQNVDSEGLPPNSTGC